MVPGKTSGEDSADVWCHHRTGRPHQARCPHTLAVETDRRRQCGIGVDAWLLNLEPISIGSNVCISQGAMLCTGSHDAKSPTFEFDNAPIVIEDGAWVATRATILRGVTIGRDSVIGATALVYSNVPQASRVLASPTTIQTRR